jgi:MOSC domain-containing protein YiiM
VKLHSVNIGREKAIQYAKSSGKTGIYKIPADAPVGITSTGLVGDAISDKKNHGGVDQAVYVYGVPDYQWWSTMLGRELSPGTFGENLTISGLESARFRIGDRLTISSVVLEVTAPRIPCITLATRMGDPTFVKRFRAAERPGLYCRVIQTGPVRVGLSVQYSPNSNETVTILEMFRDFYEPDLSENTLNRFLAAPIAIRSRIQKENQLKALRSKKI